MPFKFITDNFSTKAFALLVALLLFLFVNIESSTPINVDFKIDYRLPEGMVLTNDAPLVMHATMQGPWSGFRALTPESLTPVVVDISTSGPGSVQYNIHDTDVHLPVGMRLLSMRPSELQLNLDRRVERLVAVSADIAEDPAPGHDILEVKIDPPKVRVVGPASKVQMLEFVSTKPVHVGDKREDVKTQVGLRSLPSPLKIVEKNVKIHVVISEQLSQRKLDLPVVLIGAPPGSSLSPNWVPILLKGPSKALSDIKDLVINALPEMNEGQLRFEKNVDLRTEDSDAHIQIVPPVPKVQIQIAEKKRSKK